jgi:NDP-sugar pyrophosphorylase family protein
MEAIVLAGGMATRMGDALSGRPKSLADIAGKPLLGYQVARLGKAGVGRVIIACAAGQGKLFAAELAGNGPEIVISEEPERFGRGGGIKFAARLREEGGDVYAMNGDELVDVDFVGQLAHHRESGGVATITVARPKSPFGVVELADGSDVVTGFQEAGRIPYWVSCGMYVLSEEALERFPERGDHESTTFPGLAGEGSLRGFRHEGLWLTVNTPKELATASAHCEAHPEWLT